MEIEKQNIDIMKEDPMEFKRVFTKKIEDHKLKDPEPMEKDKRDFEVDKINKDKRMIANNLIMIDKGVIRNLWIVISIFILLITFCAVWFNINFAKKDFINNIPVSNNNQNNFTIVNNIPQSNNIVNSNSQLNNTNYINVQVNVTIENPKFTINTNSS